MNWIPFMKFEGQKNYWGQQVIYSVAFKGTDPGNTLEIVFRINCFC